jgi:hypothetical protein
MAKLTRGPDALIFVRDQRRRESTLVDNLRGAVDALCRYDEPRDMPVRALNSSLVKPGGVRAEGERGPQAQAAFRFEGLSYRRAAAAFILTAASRRSVSEVML